MSFDPLLAMQVLRANIQQLGADPLERDAYIHEAETRLGIRSAEDRREAAKLAVETAKMLLTIGVGVLIASFAWMQFAHNGGVSWTSFVMFPFYFCAFLLVWSMIAGFTAISRVYKRADGREAPTELPWGTVQIASKLNQQSMTGVLALIVLFCGVIWMGINGGGPKPVISVTIPASSSSGPPSGSLEITGTWTELRLKTAANQEIKLPQQTMPLTLTCQ